MYVISIWGLFVTMLGPLLHSVTKANLLKVNSMLRFPCAGFTSKDADLRCATYRAWLGGGWGYDKCATLRLPALC